MTALLLGVCHIDWVNAQTLRGQVVDAKANKAIPYANVLVEGSEKGVGTSCDIDGHFRLQLPESLSQRGRIKLRFSSMGYKSADRVWHRGEPIHLGRITLEEAYDELEAVVVRPRKERYRRKNNPAVMLIERVIAAKEQNRISAFEDYSYQEYEKILISQIGSRPGKKYFGLKAEVADRFRDTASLISSHTMPLSLREKQTIFAARRGASLIPIITGRRLHGVEAAMDEGGTTNSIDMLLADFDVYNNNLELLLTEFPSPLNKQWATHFYKYYIQDTVSYEGTPCFLMHFRPMSPRSVGMNGHIWIDTIQLSMRHVEMTLPHVSSVNWVERMSISTSFASVQTPRGEVWLPKTKKLGIVLKPTGLIKQGLEVEVERDYHSYRFGQEALRPEYLDPRSLLPEQERLEAMLIKPGNYGIVERPLALSSKEQKAVDFVNYLHSHRGFNIVSSVGRLFATGFFSIPMAPLNKERIKFDLGPYETLVGYNELEGVRLRLGGMTTANLMQHLFLEGYVGYGLRDERWKYYAQATFTPKKRNYHAFEHPRDHLSAVVHRDLFIPGDEGSSMFKDGLASLLGNIDNRIRFYGDKYSLRYVKDWTDQLSTNISAEYIRKTPTGDLAYYRLDEQLKPQRVDHIAQTSINLSANLSIGGGRFRQVRQGKSFDLTRYRPSFGLSLNLYPKGLPGNTQTYAHLSGSYSQRIHLSLWGRLDAEVNAGIALGAAPQTSLFHPTANTGWILRGGAFQTLQPLEYIADRYLRFQGTYHMNGLILSRLPLIKHLNLREVVSLHGFWGDMSTSARHPRVGMEYLPQFARPMNNHLHLELSTGIENILNVVRVDYFYRLTNPHLPGAHRHALRVQTKISF
ncbi:MAG: DUF5686 family protein [Porphyromonadaceae bacterium]|nr:DUF5686 family protein [Porphyromonadaceae bacterium]